MDIAKAKKVIVEIKAALEEVDGKIKNHPYLAALEQKKVSSEALKGFAGHQYYIIHSDLRSIAALLSRHESEAGRRYLTSMVLGETAAAAGVLKFAAALGVDEAWLAAYEPAPEGVAYPGYVAWLGAFGCDAELAAGFLVNLEAWGANCGRMGKALERTYGFKLEELEFFTMFAESPPDFLRESLEVVAAGLERGVAPARLARAARLLQGYELMYWDAMSAL